jgi:hypothetical protein
MMRQSAPNRKAASGGKAVESSVLRHDTLMSATRRMIQKGFEGRESHRTLFASGDSIAWEEWLMTGDS